MLLQCILNAFGIRKEVKYLIEHDKKEFKKCIITLYIKETPDKNISDTPNELKTDLIK